MLKNIIFLMQLTAIWSLPVPMQFPLLQPLQGTLQQQHLALQEQMFAVQQFQAMQQLNLIPGVNTVNPPPLLLLVPSEIKTHQSIENISKNRYPISSEDDDADSITIDAKEDEKNEIPNKNSMKAYILLPNARFSIGGIISQIPFLPIEINVPDTISWIYNGISNWISGWRRPLTEQSGNMKSDWKVKPMPVLVMPLGPNMM